MNNSWTQSDIDRLNAKNGRSGIVASKKENAPGNGKKTGKASKYKNVPTFVDGMRFASGWEAERYIHLRRFLEMGCLKYLFCQYPFELNQKGNFSYKYIADFVYAFKEVPGDKNHYGQMVVEDAKGAKTKVFLKKQKLMKRIYNIEILLSKK